MTPDDAMLIAYVDGELGPIDAKRVERAIAADPVLAQQVEAQRALRTRVANAFAPVVKEAVPDRLAALIRTSPTPLPRRGIGAARWWSAGMAVAAALVLAIGVGQWRSAPDGADRADAALAALLDHQPSGTPGQAGVLLSFRNAAGAYCRVYEHRSDAGIACRAGDGWQVVRHGSGVEGSGGDYRQAGASEPELLAAAQDMMVGEPLDAAGEAAAQRNGWQPQ